MYVLLSDETNQRPGEKERFFIYGGIWLPVELMPKLAAVVFDARNDAGLRADEELKFDTRSRPSRVSREAYTEAKRAVLEGAAALGVRFAANLVLHDVAWSRKADELVLWGANTVLLAFHNFLQEENKQGLCIMDRLPFDSAYPYLREKHQKGLVFPNGGTRVLADRIHLFGFTCSGASYWASAADIVLGSFRYCVNERDRTPACKAMWPHVAKMTWHKVSGGRVVLREHGLLFRPKIVREARYQAEYDGLEKHLASLLAP